MVTWQALEVRKFSKIVLKVFKEYFDNTCKKSYLLLLPVFSRIFYDLGWVAPPPDALNRFKNVWIL